MKKYRILFLTSIIISINILFGDITFPDKLGTSSTSFIDSSGREVILNGVNLIDKDANDGFMEQHDPDTIFSNLKKWGFNSLRLGVTWADIEPQPLQYDDNILGQIEEWVQVADSYDVKIILDMHQDIYSAEFGEDGAPGWACFPEGGKHRTLDFWSGPYFISDAVQTSFENFWNNKTVPASGIGLQDHYAKMWKYVVENLKQYDNVVGYDIMNEPFNGKHGRWMVQKMMYALDLLIAHNDCVYGTEYAKMVSNSYNHTIMHNELHNFIESDAESFTADLILTLLFNGASSAEIRDEFYSNRWKYPHFDAWNGSWFLTRNWWTLKQKRSEFGVWAQSGDSRLYSVFDAYTNKPWKYQIFTEAMAPENREFEENELQSFYQKMRDEIRKKDNKTILFLEHSYFANMGLPTGIEPVKTSTGAEDPNVAYAPHAYDTQVGLQRFTAAHNTRIKEIFNTISESGNEMDVPTWVGEWGALYEVPEEKSDRAIKSAKAAMREIEKNKLSQCYYDYISNGNKYFQKIIRRTYPMAVAGELSDYENNFSDSSFTCTWNEKENINKSTIIYVPFNNLNSANIDCSPSISPDRISIINKNDYSYLVISPSGSSKQQNISIDFSIEPEYYTRENTKKTKSLQEKEFKLGSAYPNPFNPTTTINFNVPKRSDVVLKIFNINGKLIEKVNYGNIKGSYKYQFDGSQLSSGVYIYKLDAGSFIQSKTMTLIK